jgi:hypothetical protein
VPALQNERLGAALRTQPSSAGYRLTVECVLD